MKHQKSGFTLIELSIVLVIIGLIVGGVLVGRDLIAAAEIRAQISQIEKYNTAANTFKVKYGGLPGDLLSTEARAFGLFFAASVPTIGRGDGNGSITTDNATGQPFLRGEVIVFWRHLTEANLIEGSYSAITGADAGNITAGGSMAVPPTTREMMGAHLPEAKISKAGSITVGAWNNNIVGAAGSPNYFAIAGLNNVDTPANPSFLKDSTNILTPPQAFSIDTKIDDGMPNTGTVRATDAAWPQNPKPGLIRAPLAACVTSSVYVVSGANSVCSLQIKLK